MMARGGRENGAKRRNPSEQLADTVWKLNIRYYFHRDRFFFFLDFFNRAILIHCLWLWSQLMWLMLRRFPLINGKNYR